MYLEQVKKTVAVGSGLSRMASINIRWNAKKKLKFFNAFQRCLPTAANRRENACQTKPWNLKTVWSLALVYMLMLGTLTRSPGPRSPRTTEQICRWDFGSVVVGAAQKLIKPACCCREYVAIQKEILPVPWKFSTICIPRSLNWRIIFISQIYVYTWFL